MAWESLPEHDQPAFGHIQSERLEVLGGWIICTTFAAGHAGTSVSQIFVPDPNHEWKVEQKK